MVVYGNGYGQFLHREFARVFGIVRKLVVTPNKPVIVKRDIELSDIANVVTRYGIDEACGYLIFIKTAFVVVGVLLKTRNGVHSGILQVQVIASAVIVIGRNLAEINFEIHRYFERCAGNRVLRGNKRNIVIVTAYFVFLYYYAIRAETRSFAYRRRTVFRNKHKHVRNGFGKSVARSVRNGNRITPVHYIHGRVAVFACKSVVYGYGDCAFNHGERAALSNLQNVVALFVLKLGRNGIAALFISKQIIGSNRSCPVVYRNIY